MTRKERFMLRGSLIIGLALSAFALAPPVAANCVECSPARPVTEELWGQLEPVDPDPLPSLRDSTEYDGHNFPNKDLPLWMDLDVEEGYIFTAYSSGFQIWDARESPENPERVSFLDGWDDDFPIWAGDGHKEEVIKGVDAPPGFSDMVAVVCETQGLMLIDTTDKKSPKVIYQNSGFSGRYVYTTQIGNRYYAFAGNTSGGGPRVYDMTAADELTTKPCVEEPDQEGSVCPGVYLGPMSTSRVTYLHGADQYLATSRDSVKLWDVSDPQKPDLKADVLSSLNPKGVALWQDAQDHEYYLAVRYSGGASIFEVSSCLASGCDDLGKPVWEKSLRTLPAIHGAAFSRWKDDIPVIHFGALGSTGPPRYDFLFDVSNPAAPTEIIPRDSNGEPKTITVDGVTLDYITYYYESSPTGSRNFAPVAAKFDGEYLYRAFRTVFDIHRWSGPSNPRITVSVREEAPYYQDDLLTFDATANSACSPTAGAWEWSVDDGEIVSGSGTDTVEVHWPTETTTPGDKAVEASNPGCPNADLVPATIHVDDPAPNIGDVTATPSTAPLCTPITFEAHDVTGKPDLAFSWEVEELESVGGTGNPYLWET
ncbi:MAG: hypothetical protein ACOC92_00475, partial [bacterium]